jgi:hypothetical protein
LRRRRREWFLDEYVLSVLERELREFKMRPYGGDNRDNVHLRAGQYLHLIRGNRHFGVSATDARERFGVLVTDRNNIGFLVALKVSHDIRAPVTVPDNADTKHVPGKA